MTCDVFCHSSLSHTLHSHRLNEAPLIDNLPPSERERERKKDSTRENSCFSNFSPINPWRALGSFRIIVVFVFVDIFMPLSCLMFFCTSDTNPMEKWQRFYVGCAFYRDFVNHFIYHDPSQISLLFHQSIVSNLELFIDHALIPVVRARYGLKAEQKHFCTQRFRNTSLSI